MLDTATRHAVGLQAHLLAHAWSRPAGRPSARLTAAIFATLASDRELLDMTAGISAERLPPLLFCAATTYLVRQLGPEPLRSSYPVAGRPQPPLHRDFTRNFRAFCLDNRDALGELCATRRYRMSEVARCAHFLPALASAAAGRDVALIDLGAGAGFDLHLERYRYLYRDGRGAARTVGAGSAPLTIETTVRGARRPPVPEAPPRIVARMGVDDEPAAVGDPDVRAWLSACVPPEADAMTRFERAADLAVAEEATVVRADLADAFPALVAAQPPDAHVCVLDAHVHLFLPPARRARIAALIAAAGRTRDLDWLALNPLVPLGPHSQHGVVGIDVPAAIVERSRTAGAFGVLGRLAWRSGRARASLLALGHPGGAWLEWLGDGA